MKGQQLPWKDKPGKIAQRVPAALKPFSTFFILIISRQYTAQQLHKHKMSLSVVAEQR